MPERFDIENNPVLNLLQRFGDLILVSVLFSVCSLPIITLGAAAAAAWHDMIKIIRGEQSFTVRNYFAYFRDDFRQATRIWLIMLAAGIIIGGDIYFAYQPDSGWLYGLRFFFIGAAVLYAAVLLYVFPLAGTFENPCLTTIKNAAALSARHLSATLRLFLIWLGPAVLVLLIKNIEYYLISYYFFFGFGIDFYFSAYILDQIFRSYTEAPQRK